jgi:hypothetical protein
MSELVEIYEKKLSELRNELPEKSKFIKVWVYKEGKLIEEFELKNYERHLGLLDKDAIGVMKDQFIQLLVNAGYAVDFKINEAKYEPRIKEYAKKEVNLINRFKSDLMKEHEHENVPTEIHDDSFKLAKKYRSEGSFEFIEEAYKEIVDLCKKASEFNKF